MRIAFLGKGGSGKTTLVFSFVNYLKKIYKNNNIILSVDLDLNNNLANLFNLKEFPLTFGDNYKIIFEYLFLKRNFYNLKIPYIGSIPPSYDSQFIDFDKENFIIKNFFSFKENIGIGMIGGYTKEQVGAWCYHGRLEGIELFLQYLIDKNEDFFIADFNQGIDVLSSSLYFSFNQYIFVIEPTLKSINIFFDYLDILPEETKKNIDIKVIVNKVYNEEEKKFVLNYIDENYILGYINFYQKGRDMNFYQFLIDNYSCIFEKILISSKKSPWQRDFYFRKIVEQFLKKIDDDNLKKIIDYNFDFKKFL